MRTPIDAAVTDRPERLFLALWPDEEQRSRIAAVVPGLALHGGRPVPPSNFHLTLIFLGACERARRACVEHAAASVAADAFDLTLTHAEWRRRGGIVWLAAPEIPAALETLVRSLTAGLVRCGYTAPPRPYRPHLTVARDVRRLGAARAFEPIPWRVCSYCLVVSTLTSRGAQYVIARRWPLA